MASSPGPIHPFPARMAPEIALEALSDLPAGSTVLDPMCGSGSVLRSAIERGHRAVGVDLDPMAVLLSKVWTTPIHAEHLGRAIERTVARAREIEPGSVSLPAIDEDKPTREFVDFWFAQPQQLMLRQIAGALPSARTPTGRALRLVLSRLIITKDRGASRARDVSHSRPHRVYEDSGVDVLERFLKSGKRLADQLASPPLPAGASVYRGDARQLGRVRSTSIDAVVTSPPYLNAIDYMRGHRLALVWLGHRIGDLSRIRSRSVGAERAPERAGSDAAWCVAQSLIGEAPLPARDKRIFQRYVADLDQVLAEVVRVLRPGHPATFVMGNSTRFGITIDNAAALEELARARGFRRVQRYERDLPANHRYLPPPHGATSTLSQRMRTEAVITLLSPHWGQCP